MTALVQVDVEDRLAIVRIDRPPVNALNSAVLEELFEAFSGLGARDDVGVIVLTGAGEKAFVAGADIAEMVGKGGIEMGSSPARADDSAKSWAGSPSL